MELKDLGLQRINLDLSNNITENFFAKEGDVGTRGLSIKVLNNSVEIDTTGVSITMHARVGQEVYSVDATVKDASKGEYELIYPTSILKSGIVYAELQLKKLTDIISTKKFKILVESGIVTDSAIEGHDSYPIFKQLLEAGANEVTRESNEEIRKLNEIARDEAESLRGVRLGELEVNFTSHKEDYATLEGMVTSTIDGDITNVLNNELVSTDIANKLNAKEIEYAPRLTSAESQLADNANITARNSLSTREGIAQTSRNQELIRPLVTFIDDDGYSGVITKLKPLFTSRNVPLGLALIGNSQVVVDPIKRADILDLQDNHGWEVLSHTMAHMHISEVTAEEYEQDSQDFIRTFNSYGFNVQSIAYTWGEQEPHREITAKYYSSGFGTGSSVNKRETIDNYAINRYGLGSSHAPGVGTLEEFKNVIDSAKANKEWLVFMTHVDDPTNDMQLITDVLDYVIEQGIEIVKPSDGVRIFGSVLQSGRRNRGSYFNIKPGGYVDTDLYSLPRIIKTKGEDDPPNPNKNFEVNMFAAYGWSIGEGIVTEHLHNEGWQYQEFKKSGSDARVYIRKWTGVFWKPWFKYGVSLPDFVHTVPALTIEPHSTYNVTILASDAVERHRYIASPTGPLENGIMWSCWSHGNGAIRLRLANVTTSSIALAERMWNIARFDTY